MMTIKLTKEQHRALSELLRCVADLSFPHTSEKLIDELIDEVERAEEE